MTQRTVDVSLSTGQRKLSGDDKRQFVRQVFDRLAPVYDRMNLVISFGQTTLWRNRALRTVDLDNLRIVDVGCGSGISTRQLRHYFPNAQIEGIDFSAKMIDVAHQADPSGTYRVGDVEHLPFPDGSVDAVVTIYTTRNFPDFEVACAEMMRILRPGGRLIVLDCFPGRAPRLWEGLQILWLSRIVPFIARPFASPDAYRYLAGSIQAHVTVTEAVAVLTSLGAVVAPTDYSMGSATRLVAIKGNGATSAA